MSTETKVAHTAGPWRVDDKTQLRMGDCSLNAQVWASTARVAFIESQNVGDAESHCVMWSQLRSSTYRTCPAVQAQPRLGARSQTMDDCIHCTAARTLLARIDGETL